MSVSKPFVLSAAQIGGFSFAFDSDLVAAQRGKYGGAAGDEVTVYRQRILAQLIRAGHTDILARVGGISGDLQMQCIAFLVELPCGVYRAVVRPCA